MKKIWKRNQIMITALALMIAVAGYLNFMSRQVDEKDLFTTSAQFEEEVADAAQSTDQSADASDGTDQVDSAGAMAQLEDVTQTDELALISEDTGEYDALTDIDSMDSEDEMVYSDYLDDEQNAQAMSEGSVSLQETADVDASDETAKATEDYDGEIPGEAVFTSGVSISSIESANLLKEQTREKNKEMLLEIINSDTVSDSAKQSAVDSMINLTDIAQKECSAQILLEAKGFEDVVVSISGQQVDVIVEAEQLTDAQRAQIEDIVSRKTGIPVENIIISPVK